MRQPHMNPNGEIKPLAPPPGSSVESVFVGGQRITSRTETLEAYCIQRFPRLGIFAFASPLCKYGDGRWTLYQGKNKVDDIEFPSARVTSRILKWVLLPWIFIIIILRGLGFARRSLLHPRKTPPWDLFIGVAMISAILGLLLRKLGIVKKVVYYSLDYFIPTRECTRDFLANHAYLYLDRWTAKRVDMNWVISDRIVEAREKWSALSRRNYSWHEVPLGYSQELLHHPLPDTFDTHRMIYVGSLNETQGLQLVLQAMAELRLEMPKLTLSVVGTGPYENKLRRLAGDHGLGEIVTFHGFLEEPEMLRRTSQAALGLATWTGGEADYSRYADPGKTKLYALCGIPSILTDIPKIAQIMQLAGAGLAIPYEKQALIQSIKELLANPLRLKEARQKSRNFALSHCLAETHFKRAFDHLQSTSESSVG